MDLLDEFGGKYIVAEPLALLMDGWGDKMNYRHGLL